MTPTRPWSRARGRGQPLRAGFLGVPESVAGVLGDEVAAEPVDPRGLMGSTYDVVVCGSAGTDYAVASALLPETTPLVVHATRLDRLPDDLGRAAAVVVSSTDEADLLRRRLGADGPEVAAVPPALDVAGQARSGLDGRLIVAVGPLTSDGRHADTIRGFAEVADRLPGWRLRIVGEGGRRAALLGEARRHGLADRVEVVEAADPPAVWAEAGLGVVTARHGGLALAAEAMAAGVPVVGYDSPGGPRDLLVGGQAGALVPPGDFRALGAALLRLAEDPARSELGAEAAKAAQLVDPATAGAAWTALLTRLADSEPPDPQPDPPHPSAVLDPVPALTPSEARTEILAWVTRSAAAASDFWWVIPTPHGGDPVVALPWSARARFLEELTVDAAPAYAWPGLPGLLDRLSRGAEPVLSLAPAPGPAGRPHHLSAGAGVDVEFWTEADGLLYAPRANVFGRRVDPAHRTTTAVVAGVEVRTLPLLTRPSVHECRFPIDVVYTWVDGADPGWLEARNRRLGDAAQPQAPEAAGDARFRARDELRYSMRSVHLFAPWVRTIHLVTDGQRPEWLADDPRIDVVDHREILPADVLPTFNSHAIETGLHRVPGLAEHFVYLNDDVLLGRPLPPTAFFTPGGLPLVFPDVWPIGIEDRPERPDLMAGANNRLLLERDYDVSITLTLAHTPHPHRVSLLAEMAERYAPELGRTAATPFRSATDVSPLSSLGQHLGLVTGRAVVGPHENRLVNLASARLPRQLRGLRGRDQDSFCLGDHHDYALPEDQVGTQLGEFLDDYYPVAAPWER